jgi:hypothetical protein
MEPIMQEWKAADSRLSVFDLGKEHSIWLTSDQAVTLHCGGE